MAFKKRKNTIFIGTETAGYITAKRGFEISNAITLLLSSDYGKDGMGQVYDLPIKPDIKETDSFNDIKNDKKSFICGSMIRHNAGPKPPPWADKLLRWRLGEGAFEEVTGDLQEMFEHWSSSISFHRPTIFFFEVQKNSCSRSFFKVFI